jgi:hypothetical protein
MTAKNEDVKDREKAYAQRALELSGISPLFTKNPRRVILGNLGEGEVRRGPRLLHTSAAIRQR